MNLFGMYLTEGFWLLIQSLIPAAIIYALINVALYLFKKRRKDFYKNNKLKIVGECLFVIFLFVILRITGITDGSYYFDGFNRISAIEIGIPFCGASEIMVFLNTLMFVPFGFFAAMAFKKLGWAKVLLLSFTTTFIIEFLQLFNGRNAELDDIIANVFGAMCGYFIFRGINLLLIKAADVKQFSTKQKGVLTLTAILLCSTLYAVTVHCLANGDRIQAEIDSMYHEIDSTTEEYDYISKMTYYDNIRKYEINFNSQNTDSLNIYSFFGSDINNQVYSYVESTKQGNICDVTIEIPDEYLMISYSKPQSFNFYNNENLEITNAETLLYNLDNGTLYFSEKNSGEYKVWTLDTAKQPFCKDEELYEEIFKMIM